MILLLCIANIWLCACMIAKARPGIGLVRLAVFTVCSFFFLYTVVSAGFFWADVFDFVQVLTVCLALEAAADAALIRREFRRAAAANGRQSMENAGESPSADSAGGGPETASGAGTGSVTFWQALRPDVTWDVRACALPLLVVILALPFTWNKFELYSMGQDQGTYQVKALALMAYDTHNYMEMEEFTKLETDEERQKYLDFVYGQNNLYLPRVIEETDTDAANFDRIIGTIHGLPTYSAVLALWGILFGYAQMIGVQTVLYICLIFLVWFIAEQMKLRRVTCFLLSLLTAFSPIILWGSKSSLTEVGLAVIFAVFLLILTGERKNAWMAWIPLTAFAFSHISIYVFMPILIIVLFVMYFTDGEKGWLVSVIGTLTGYALSAFWSFAIAPYYSYGNYNVLWKISRQIINENNIKPVILLLCVVLGGGAVFLMSGKGAAFAESIRCKAGQSRLFAQLCRWGIRVLLLVSALFFVYKGVIQAEYVRYFEYLQISTYLYMTGLVLIPFLFVFLFWKPEQALRRSDTAALTLLFFYCVIAYSSFMRLDVLFYYYYARYVTIFLSIVFLLAGRLLEETGTGRRQRLFAAGMLVLAFVSFLPYDLGLRTQKDHTRCEWEVLGDVCEDITAEDAFIVGPDEQQIVFIFPVKLLTGCDVYYADENLRGQIGKLSLRYRNVYYLDYEGELEKKMEADENWQDGALTVNKVYTNWNHLSYLDYFNITNPWTPIPLNYVEYRLKLSLHEISLSESWEEEA
ncbi:hypothetical protein V1224_12805 [Lachnospiraceae bacterium JLR.KK008]